MSSPHQSTPAGQHQSAQPQQQPANTNYVSLCRVGQDTVQDIVQKTNEMFQILKSMQLPNETALITSTFNDRKTKLEEHSKLIVQKFKTLHVIYDKINEYTATLDPTTEVHSQPSEALQTTTEEHKEVVEQVKSKNAQLKEIIDHLRTVVWEINTMIAMRKTVVP